MVCSKKGFSGCAEDEILVEDDCFSFVRSDDSSL